LADSAAQTGNVIPVCSLTSWRTASAVSILGIDDYLADLNVLVDEIGAPVDLIGLCQGGWMALVYAARFPGKVRKLVLVGSSDRYQSCTVPSFDACRRHRSGSV
jgi:pimeloyl-ACP methyl ester carboxylesterase